MDGRTLDIVRAPNGNRIGADTAGDGAVVCQVRELAAGGDGVATLPDGRILFVPFTAPGERVEVEVVESHPRWARGRPGARSLPARMVGLEG